MEAGTNTAQGIDRLPTWALIAVPLALIAAAVALFAALGGPGLDERRGPPVEELAVERTVLRPGEIELTRAQHRPRCRSTSPRSPSTTHTSTFAADPEGEVGHLGRQKLTLDYPWQEGGAYDDLDADLDGGDDRRTRSTSRSRRPRSGPASTG